MTLNIEAQNEELLALQSIYDTKYFIVDQLDPPCGRYSADVQIPDLFNVVLKDTNCSNIAESSLEDSKSESDDFFVEFLPPINLYFEFPESYPSDTPPAFFLSCSWLSYDQLTKICRQLDSLWKEGNGEVVLFQWIQFLKEETLNYLGIDNNLNITELSKYKLGTDYMNNVPFANDSFKSNCETGVMNPNSNQSCNKENLQDRFMPIIKPSITGGNGSRDSRAVLDIADGRVLKNLLKDYNEYKKSEYFSDTYHLCTVCCDNKYGADFVTFKQCQHFFCKDCIKSYFELLITEGNVNGLNCPQDKCDTQADGSLVKQIVDKDIFERYDSLLLVRTLETMSDIAYCPRTACQCPLLIDVGERIGTCPACNFTFCPFCKMAYHGVAPCNMKTALKKKIFDDYINGDAEKKAELERRHGKRAITSLVEEMLSENWIGSNSKSCPHCQVMIEKNDGCNKMTCYRCGSFFCWLCMRVLKAANPYTHYSDKGSECYNRLHPYPPEDMFYDELLMFEEPGAFLDFLG